MFFSISCSKKMPEKVRQESVKEIFGRVSSGVVRETSERMPGRSFLKGSKGQATVEGALLIPVFLMVILLLIQPSILLYDRMVMQNAAAEGCRLLVTADFSQTSYESIEAAVLHRLAAIPEQDHFHVHEGGCSYEIELQGSETSQQVGVSISQEVKLLPLFDVGAKALGIVNEKGNFVLE
ncbi:MAG: TadE/TadG family type IV pilus assembly protein, partial [Anaerotardibacter sp.]